MPICVGIIVIASGINVLAWLKNQKEELYSRFCRFSHLPVWYLVILFSNANSLVSDENAREWLVGFILALHYAYTRVMNMSFCTHLMGTPFFLVAIPTYGVLPYSMICVYVSRLGMQLYCVLRMAWPAPLWLSSHVLLPRVLAEVESWTRRVGKELGIFSNERRTKPKLKDQRVRNH